MSKVSCDFTWTTTFLALTRFDEIDIYLSTHYMSGMRFGLLERRVAGYDPLTARVLGMYHIHAGESSAEARSTAERGLADYHAAAAQARSLNTGAGVLPQP